MLPVSDPGGAPPWRELRELSVGAERAGLDSVWAADHLVHRPDDGDLGGYHEAWTLLTAIAAVTERIELAPLVLCASFRSPGLTAKMAVTLDEVSNGRLILGVGAGWHDPEYEMFGLPTDHKVGRFDEWLQILAGLLDGERVTFDGRYFETREAVLVPAPARRIPILVAGKLPRMLRLTARYADAWNTAWYGRPNDVLRERLAAFDEALAAEGRAPDTLERTVGLILRAEDAPAEDAEPFESFTGGVEELAELFRTYDRLGFAHAIVLMLPPTAAAVEQVAAAAALSRG